MSYPKTIEECTACAIQYNTLLKEYYEQGKTDGRNELKAQKEKAESELKAIREVITRYENGSCLQKCEKHCSDCLAKEIIKQIGGGKMSMIIGKFYKGVEETKFRFGVKIAKFTGFSGNGWLMFESKNGRYKLCNNGGNYQEATIEEEYKQGKADGEREMWEKMKPLCEGKAYFDGNNAAECKDNCTFENCPIAKGGK